MKLKDYIRLGWDQLQRRKVVTALCTVGIAIGSASIMVALGFGESIQHYSQKQMSFYLKTDEITIQDQPDDPSGQGKITAAKLDLIRTFPHVKSVASFQELGNFQFTVDDGKQSYFNLIATELNTLVAFDNKFQQGGITENDNSIVVSYGSTMGLMDEKTQQVRSKLYKQNSSKEMEETLTKMNTMLYPLLQKQLLVKFSNADNQPSATGSKSTTIRQPEITFRVTGILKKPEGLPDSMVQGNKTAYVSPDMGRKILELMNKSSGNGRVNYSSVRVKVDSSSHVKEVDDLIKKLRLTSQSNLYQEDRMKGQFAIVRLLLTGIGLFVLLVASISIVVAMTMSTHQRRRQIGIMKVLGANLKQIRNMFIVESSLLGMLGGFVGILLSYWVIWGINLIIIKFGSNNSGENAEILFISLWILPVGMFFAIMTGVLSGLYPAVKASRTDALTAIKRE
ncbi:FtsX-like permease family protein [Paenibacillus sp. SYP-B3998]|uniref:FtsX-like permease family protein n=1 Tax=Paenibacillus sp. SYP-B3998 TaxID=2678564 RepID=A0A6G4A381_9BACL|nr:ABC transporter permease [Paenibacillus sp. SYP-B3998]NEW08748.1 FtsX-like permease family protein [Paenibacillus sp. SYP-B3998]